MRGKTAKMPDVIDFSVYFLILFFSIITGLFVYFLGFILRYKTKKNTSNPCPESNLETNKNQNIKYRANFLNYIICFLIFETACIIMFPFACLNGALDIFYCTEIMIFILILILILLFSIKSGLLNITKE